MKHVYKCEKCGALYDEYDECEKCENSHMNLNCGFDWDDDDEFKKNVMERTKYKEGNPNPDEIAIMLYREYYDSKESTWKKEREIGIYKLKCTMPIGDKNI